MYIEDKPIQTRTCTCGSFKCGQFTVIALICVHQTKLPEIRTTTQFLRQRAGNVQQVGREKSQQRVAIVVDQTSQQAHGLSVVHADVDNLDARQLATVLDSQLERELKIEPLWLFDGAQATEPLGAAETINHDVVESTGHPEQRCPIADFQHRVAELLAFDRKRAFL